MQTSGIVQSESLVSIYPVMRKYGVTCTPDEFHRTLNLIFHKTESRVYDAVHKDMWKSLPQQIDLLVSDYLGAGCEVGENLALLDVGCGTGLASELLLKTAIGQRISEADLLDMSAEMLQRVRERSANWRPRVSTVNGTIETIAGRERRYDIILISSVLHHIPDLATFLRHVRSLQLPAGILIHMQDPNGDYLGDPALEQRMAELDAYERPNLRKWLRRLSPRRVIGRFNRVLTGTNNDDYLAQVNNELLQSGVICSAMDPRDIWAVTDIHVHNGAGVSINKLGRLLADYRLISKRSYSFFGKMISELPEAFKRRESELIEAKLPNGLEISALWKLKTR